MTEHPHTFVQVVFASPLKQHFDYYLPANLADKPIKPGMRVWVSFGKRECVGFVVGQSDTTAHPIAQLKPIIRLIDEEPLINDALYRLCQWTARYYHHSLGGTLATAVGPLLRKGRLADCPQEFVWQCTQTGLANVDECKRAPQQAALLRYLIDHPKGVSQKALRAAKFTSQTLHALGQKGWIEKMAVSAGALEANQSGQAGKVLNADQQSALDQIMQALGSHACFLLEGVTGSGKTEVYLQVIERILARQEQALVLVPEISLTPQTVSRFRQRFNMPVAVCHSDRTDRERLQAWLAARSGQAAIIIGTRSAIFTPLSRPGLIVVDEEHDLSFKQQEGLRYSARDLAIVRARLEGIPVILGSATPSAESLYNVRIDRYRHCHLPKRAGVAVTPQFDLLDIRGQRLQEGISPQLLKHMRIHLEQGNQILLFINRRGFAPIIICHQCGWVANCRRCDAKLTLHQASHNLRCHHCQAISPLPAQCPECQQADLRAYGLGTERVEDVLKQTFPDYPLVRVDSDAMRAKDALSKALQGINDGSQRILVGTQILAKGHHFPGVTLVAILDADAGLFSCDFRTSERIGQLLMQVAGRAGRSDKPGQVIIQTRHPTHPLLQCLIKKGYPDFAAMTLKERQAAGLPPYAFFVLLRADALKMEEPLNFLTRAKAQAREVCGDLTHVLGPVPAPMAKRAGRYRAQLLIQSSDRKALHKFLQKWVPQLAELQPGKRVRWSLDIDPQEMF